MSNPPSLLHALPALMRVGLAARLTGVPLATLRDHVDSGEVMGVHRTPGGHRFISREGLLAYMQARGIEAKHLEAVEHRRAERIVWVARPRVTRLTVLEPGTDKVMGQGEGALMDLSGTGFRLKHLSWKGYLPGPETQEVAFRVSNTGRHRRSEGRAEVAWIQYRGGALEMGLRILKFADGESRRRWEEFVEAGQEVERRHAVGVGGEGPGPGRPVIKEEAN